MTTRSIAATLLLALAGGGCASTPTMYRWGKYDEHVYHHYKAPQDREAWVGNLRRVVLEAEQGDGKVPPGAYAELGYALFEQGQYAEAATWFRKEHELWPESRVLMDKMIRLSERSGSQPTREAPQVHGAASALQQEASR